MTVRQPLSHAKLDAEAQRDARPIETSDDVDQRQRGDDVDGAAAPQRDERAPMTSVPGASR